MPFIKQELRKWKSGKFSIIKSNSHVDMYIIEDGSNGFWSITASEEYMLKKYPKD